MLPQNAINHTAAQHHQDQDSSCSQQIDFVLQKRESRVFPIIFEPMNEIILLCSNDGITIISHDLTALR